MNIDFEIINGKANILTDNKGRIKRDATNNIEDILICENNIEEIEDNLHESKKLIILLQNKIWSNCSTIATSVLLLATGILASIMGGPWWSIVLPYLGAASFAGLAFDDIKTNLNLIRGHKEVIKELATNLQSEKEKLNKLNNEKTTKLVNIPQNNLKTINRSIEIRNLKRKLNVIKYYQSNKSKLIKAYKKGNLRQITTINFFGYNDNLLLEELIKNDLNNKNIKEINKQKVLEKK